MHQNEWFQVWFFKKFLGRGSPSPLPRPLPPFFLGLRPRFGLRPQFSGASRLRLGRFAPSIRAPPSTLGLRTWFGPPQNKFLDPPLNLTDGIEIGNGSEVWEVGPWQTGLFEKRCNESVLEFRWEGGLIKGQVRKVRYENWKCSSAWYEQRCCNIIKWWRFVRHWVEQLCRFGWSVRCEIIECLSSVLFVKSKWRWRAAKFGGYREFERDDFLTEETG